MKTVNLISLDRCYDRREDMVRQFSEKGIPYAIIDAVDGKTSEVDEWEVDRQAFVKIYGREIRNGEIGCYASHLRALCRITSTESDYGIVMEDDVILLKSASQCNEVIDKIQGLRDYNGKWMIYPGNPLVWHGHEYDDVEYHYGKGQNCVNVEINKNWPALQTRPMRMNKALLGTQCYIISVQFANHILTHWNTIYRPIDEVYRLLCLDPRFKFYHFPKSAWICQPNFQVPSEIRA